MTGFKKKCDTYNAEVEANRKLIKFYGLIVWLPAIFLALLGIVLTIITGIKHVPYFYALLIFVVAGLIYFFVMGGVLKSKFAKNNEDIVNKYMEYYKLPAGVQTALIVKEDNLGVYKKINQYGANPLFVYILNDALFFITTSIPTITNLSLKGSVSEAFENILAKDFGALNIPLNDIDNYKDDVLMVTYKDTVLKLTFKDHDFLDRLIPTKDFYFNADKKGL